MSQSPIWTSGKKRKIIFVSSQRVKNVIHKTKSTLFGQIGLKGQLFDPPGHVNLTTLEIIHSFIITSISLPNKEETAEVKEERGKSKERKKMSFLPRFCQHVRIFLRCCRPEISGVDQISQI